MVKKITRILKKNGLTGLFSNVFHRVFLLLGLEISIKRYQGPQLSIKKRIFGSKALSFNKKGFWYVDPMPSLEDLSEYYSSSYWDYRSDKKDIVIGRDIVHLMVLEKYISGLHDSSLNFLNFGAGHGGISHLMWLRGHNIINVEPSGMAKFYNQRWTHFYSFDDVPNYSLDFIYGSHSLEHIHDIDEMNEKISKKLKKGGHIFWEVPNGEYPGCGPLENEIRIPHTYYFTKDYFNSNYKNILLNETFKQTHLINQYSNWHEYQKPSNEGEVIRVLVENS